LHQRKIIIAGIFRRRQRFGFFFANAKPTFAAMAYFEKPEPVSRVKFYFGLLAGILVIALLWPLDARVGAALDVAKNPAWQHFAWWCSKIGEGWVVAVVGIFLAILFMLLNSPRIASHIFFIGTVSLLAGLAATILRGLFGRTRPELHGPHGVPPGFYGVWHDGHWIIGKAAFSSFPSGHATTAVGLAAAAWLIHRGWGMVAAIYALAVLWSRIALQWHHLSDVLASTVLGIAMAVLLKPVLLTSVEFQFGNLYRAWKRK
jgi:membrane-associated phospholipid phosphatase